MSSLQLRIAPRLLGASVRRGRILPSAAGGLAMSAGADTITVVTSFPKELTGAYKKAFEAKYPADKLEILNKNTAAGIAYVREQAAGSRPEVFWASAPDAFEVLAKGNLLQKAGAAIPPCPRKWAATRSTIPRASTWARRSPATGSCGTRAT